MQCPLTSIIRRYPPNPNLLIRRSQVRILPWVLIESDRIASNPNQTVRHAAARLLEHGLIKPGEQAVFVAEAVINGKRVETIQVEDLETRK